MKKKYEVYLEGYEYPFKVLAQDAQQAESKVRNFLKHPQKAVTAVLAKRQKLHAGYPFPAA